MMLDRFLVHLTMLTQQYRLVTTAENGRVAVNGNITVETGRGLLKCPIQHLSAGIDARQR